MEGMSIMTKLYKSKKDKEVYYYFLKNGEKRWMYRHKYYDALGKRKEKKKSGFKTEKEALRSLLELKASILNDGIAYYEKNKMTVSKWLDIWYKTYHKSWGDKTQKDIAEAIKNHLRPLLGKYTLNDLKYSTYKREFIDELLGDGYSPGTVRLYHKYFMMAINAAIRDELLKENKFKRIRIEKNESQVNDNFLSPNELKLFLEYAKKYGNITEYTLVLLLAYSGIRKGEAMGLKWSDINFNKNEITINKTRDSLGVRSPKTQNSYRTINIDPDVIKQLERYEKWCIETKLSYGIKHNPKKDFVFMNDSANPIHSYYVNIFFYKLYNLFQEHGVKMKRITPHGLRHTHATILIDMLVPPGDIAYRLGNTIEMIYKVYAHKFKKQNSEAAILFGKAVKHAIG